MPKGEQRSNQEAEEGHQSSEGVDRHVHPAHGPDHVGDAQGQVEEQVRTVPFAPPP